MGFRDLRRRLVTSPLAGWRWRVAWLVVLIVLGSGANLLWTSHAIQQNNHNWCDALSLLTRRPVPRPADPATNPSREGQYEFYLTLVVLKHRQGCD